MNHYVFQQAVEAKIKGATLSDLEYQSLQPVPNDLEHFICNLCKTTLHKRSGQNHLLKKHGEELGGLDIIKRWQVCKDAEALHHGRLSSCLFTVLYSKREAEEAEADRPEGLLPPGAGQGRADNEEEAQEPEENRPLGVNPPGSQALAPAPGILGSRDAATPTRKGELEVPAPKMSINEIAKNWQPKEDDALIRRG